MYEKILQKLKTQRPTTSNVSDRSLEDIAKSYESIIKDDEALNPLDFTKIIQSVDGNISKVAADAAKKAKDEANAQKTLDVQTQIQADLDKKRKKPQTDADEKTPEWVSAILESNKSMIERLSKLETEKTVTTRRTQLETKLKDLPDYFKKPILQSFQKTNFQDDTEFTTYLSEIETTAGEFTQSLRENGLLKTIPKGDTKQFEDTGETEQLAAARNLVKKVENNKK